VEGGTYFISRSSTSIGAVVLEDDEEEDGGGLPRSYLLREGMTSTSRVELKQAFKCNCSTNSTR